MNERTPRPREIRSHSWWRPDFAPVGAVLLALLVAAAVAGYRWLASEAALRYVVAEIVARTGGKLAVEDLSGSLVDVVRIRSLRYADGGREFIAQDALLRWTPLALLGGSLHLREFGVRRVEVHWSASGASPPQLPASLAPPFTIVIDRFVASAVTIDRGTDHTDFVDLAFRYRGDAREHRIGDLTMRTGQAALSGEARAEANAPYAVSATAMLRGGPSLHDAELDLSLAGMATMLELTAKGHVAGAQLKATVRYAPFATEPVAAYTMDVRGIELRRVDAKLPRSLLDAAIDGREEGGGRFTGTLAFSNRTPTAIDGNGLPLETLRSRYVLAGGRLVLSEMEVRLPAGGSLGGSGWIALGAAPAMGDSDWDLVAQRVDLRSLHTALVPTRLSGSLRARVTQGKSHVAVDLSQDDMALAAEADVDAASITVGRFQARAQGGQMNGRGSFNMAYPRRFSLEARASRLDPSRFGAFPAGSLDGQVKLDGALDPGWRVTGDVKVADGSLLKGVPFSGSARGSLAEAQASDAVVDVKLADARVRATGSFGRPGDRFRYRIDLPRLAGLAPIFGEYLPAGFDGALAATGEVEGSLRSFGLSLEAQGRDLAYGGFRVGTVRATASTRSAARWPEHEASVTIAMDAVAASGSRYRNARLRFQGTALRHVLEATVEGEELAAEAKLAGALGSSSLAGGPLEWAGDLTRFSNRGLHPVALLAPARLEIRWPDVTIRDARATIADGRLDIRRLSWRDGRLETQGDFTGVPANAIARLAGLPAPAATTLVLGGNWDIAASPRLNGRVRLHRERGDVVLASGTTAGLPAFDIGLAVLDVEADIADDRIDARALLQASRLGEIRGTLRIDPASGVAPGTIERTAPLRASITGELSSLRPLQPWIGTTAVVDGALSLVINVSGSLADPRATGTVSAKNVRVDAPRYGIHWRDGRATARLTDDHVILDEYSIAAGDGRLTMTGTLPLAPMRERSQQTPAAEVTWAAEHFRVANRPDLRIVASGAGTAGLRNGEVVLQGRVQIEEGRIEIEQSPGTTLGSDVVVLGRSRPEQRRAPEPLAATVDLYIDIGRRLRVTGQGVDAILEGNLRLVSGPRGDLLRAQGSVRTISGTYLAFGQRLEIDRGRLTFDGPIDNPALDLTALRKNLPVEPGVVITGTARLPQVRLTSTPPLPEGQKLAWLVLGQGLDQTTGADLATLQTAATALFGQGGPALGTRLARSVGLDDVALRSAATTDRGASQVVALSKRLTDRLYLVFEQGLTAANTALRLEYSLTRTLTLRARAGTVSSAGLHFFRTLD